MCFYEISNKETVSFAQVVSVLNRFISVLSEEYLTFSNYIPLKSIANETLKEKGVFSDESFCKLNFFISGKEIKKFTNSIFKMKYTFSDNLYASVLLKSEKFTAEVFRKAEKINNSGELIDYLKNVNSTIKQRQKKLKYLLSVI